MRTLPTETDLARLPRWCVVALAVRCARRVLPLFTRQWPDDQHRHSSELQRVVSTLEAVVEIGDGPDTNHRIIPACLWTFAERAAEAALEAGQNARIVAEQNTMNIPTHERFRPAMVVAPDASGSMAAAARTVAAAAESARCAAILGVNPVDHPHNEQVRRNLDSFAAKALHEACAAVGEPVAVAALTETVRSDLDALSAAAGSWGEGAPVPAGTFGPLWPGAIAPTLPAVAEATVRLKNLMGKYATGSVIEWAFAEGEFPSGLRVRFAMPEWALEREQTIKWEVTTSPHAFSSALAGVWDDLLTARIAAVRTNAGLGGN